LTVAGSGRSNLIVVRDTGWFPLVLVGIIATSAK